MAGGAAGRGVMAAVMASDSQILALSTMFTEDVFAFYGASAASATSAGADRTHLRRPHHRRGYVIALRIPQSIFDLATQYAFAGYASLVPLLVAACSGGTARGGGRSRARCGPPPRSSAVACDPADDSASAARRRRHRVDAWETVVITARRAGTFVLGFLPVVPMTLDFGHAHDCGLARGRLRQAREHAARYFADYSTGEASD